MIGQVIRGSYRLLEEIGSGGFATVYLARDIRSNTVVAVKVLHRHLLRDTSLVERFLDEAQLARRLSDPHIVRILDVGRDGDHCYLVMEYVEGHTLDVVLARRGPLPVADVVELGCQALAALGAAHAAGIVHRDVKPANLMLTASGRLKIMDFGIARHAGGQRTRTGMMLGTPEYMAPEQARGLRASVDGRTDLYALAVTLFELLTGRPPYQDDDPWAVLQQQVSGAIPSPRALRPDVPPALDAAIRRALAKNPSDRFQSAAEMALALRGAPASPARSQPSAVPAGRAQPSGSPPRPTPGPGAAPARAGWRGIAAVVLAIALGGLLLTTILSGASQPRPVVSGAVATAPPKASATATARPAAQRMGAPVDQAATSPPIATAPPATSTPVPGAVLLADDFDDPAHGPAGRSTSLDSYQRIRFIRGTLELALVSPQPDYVATWWLPGSYRDVGIAADVSRTQARSAGAIEVACRRATSGPSQYRAGIDVERGTTWIAREDSGHQVDLNTNGYSIGIRRGSQANRLDLRCFGSTIEFRVNDVLVASARDATYTEGRAWIGIGNYRGESGTHTLRIDNLVVTQR